MTTTLTDAAPPRELSPQRLARLTGVLYLLLVGLGMAGPLTLEALLVPGDAAGTAAAVAGSATAFTLSIGAWVAVVAVDVAISLTLYLLLARFGRGLAMAAAAFRLLYSATVAALLVELFTAHRLLVLPGGAVADPGAAQRGLDALQTFSDGFLVALVFFGGHLVLLGAALQRSGYVPRVLCWFVAAAGAGYVVDSLASLLVDSYGGAAAVVALTPTLIGEVGLALWFLIRGVRRTALTPTPRA
ncbi:DUF4386 domain-containing protein [Geodermatophilus sp. SYSU D00758]